MRFVQFYALASAVLLAPPVLAAEPTMPPAGAAAMGSLRDACADDVKQFCANVEPGQGRIVRCIRDNEDKLSQQCKDARAAARSHKEHKSGPQ